MDQINWDATPEDAEAIKKIVERAATLYKAYMGQELKDRLSLDMDLTATHLNGTPLDLAKLLAFPDTDFAHDVFGIQRHMNRNTGKLGDCFLPRCAKPEPVEA